MKMRRFFSLLLCCIIFCLLFSPRAYAWGKNWAAVFSITAYDSPLGAKYIDLLVPMEESDSEYCVFNEKNGAAFGITPESEIVSLDLDGYRSYTFHNVNAGSDIKPPTLSFFQSEDPSVQDWGRYYDCCRTYRSARLAYLDRSGHVLAVTNAAPIYDEGMDQLKVDTCSFLVSGTVSGELFETEIWWDQTTPVERFFDNLLILLIFTFATPYGWIALIEIAALIAFIIIRKKKLKQREAHEKKASESFP